jgi:hypothetical protein
MPRTGKICGSICRAKDGIDLTGLAPAGVDTHGSYLSNQPGLSCVEDVDAVGRLDCAVLTDRDDHGSMGADRIRSRRSYVELGVCGDEG